MELQTTRLALTVEDAATAASIGRTNIFRAIKERKLKARKYGRRTIILIEDLQSFLESLHVSEAA